MNAAELRQVLSSTIERLLDKTDPLDVDRARAVADVAQKIIDTAKTEIMAAKVYDDLADANVKKSEFLIEHKAGG